MAELKMINKNKCKFDNGFICKGNKIVGLPVNVAFQLQKLELMIQQYEYLAAQPKAQPMPTLDGFKFDDGLPKPAYVEQPDTPTMDARVAEALAFCDEVAEVDKAAETNRMIERFADLINWCNADKFVAGDYVSPLRCPRIGNPLKLTEAQVIGTIARMVCNPLTIDVTPAALNVNGELADLGFKKVGAAYHDCCVDRDGDR